MNAAHPALLTRNPGRLGWLWLATLTAMAVPASLAGTLSQVPLFLGSSVPPNIALGVDNSKSMESEVVMASGNSDYYMIPDINPAEKYMTLFPDGYSSIGNNIPPLPQFADARAPVRTITINGASKTVGNRAYFDPAVTYSPWASYGSVSFKNASPTAAPWFPQYTDQNGTIQTLKTNPSSIGWSTMNLTAWQGPSSTILAGSEARSPADHGFRTTPQIKKGSDYVETSSSVPKGIYVFPSAPETLKGSNCNVARIPRPKDAPRNWKPNYVFEWCRNNFDVETTDPALGIAYYPATFYLPRGSALPAGYSSYSNGANCRLSATSWDGTQWDGYQISSNCLSGTEYEAAIQNFANWFTYYRRRRLAAFGAIGSAFKGINSVRVAAFPFHQYAPGSDLGPPWTYPASTLSFLDLSDMSSTNQSKVDDLFNGINTYESVDGSGGNGTRMKAALQYMGDNLAAQARSQNLKCLKSVGVLVTDGPYGDFWNAYDVGGNVDGKYAAPIGGDNSSNSLADMAMHYYLGNSVAGVGFPKLEAPIPGACNKVSVDNATGLDCWNRPHMNLYGIAIGLKGDAFNPDRPVDAFAVNPKPTWPDADELELPLSDQLSGVPQDPDVVDDLWHATVNGRGMLLSPSRPAEVRENLLKIIRSILDSAGSGSGVSSDSGYAADSNLIYQAQFDSTNWTGDVLAYWLKQGIINTASGQEAWRASLKVPSMNNRNIYTRTTCTGPGGTMSVDKFDAFQWASLACDQTGILTDGGPGPASGNRGTWGSLRVSYLRGDTSQEARNGGEFRNRLKSDGTSNVLGDFINSGPELASKEDYGYELLPGDEGTAYSSYLITKANRTPMLYVGGNDGMLHGFTAGVSGGTETFAYIPRTAYYTVEGGSATINDYTSPGYNHRYFVDGPLRVFDAYLSKAWTSLLVGTTGAGGRAIFAVDVSQPGNLNANSIKWEISAVSDTELPDLGFTFGQPLLVRTRSATYPWVVIAANGYNSPNGIAKLMVIDPSTGSIIKWIDTKAGPNLATGGKVAKNGLSSPIAVDVEQDRIVDYVYAGDLEGNLWKFDFTSANHSSWGVAYGTASDPSPLFVACSTHTSSCSDANRQPITAKPQVAAAPLTLGGMMIYFGTGRYLEDSDKIIANNEQMQSFYGVWDKNLGTTADDVISSHTNLVKQTITNNSLSQNGSTLRLTSGNAVDFTKQNGWYLDLSGTTTAQGERVISAANFHNGRITFASFLPSTTPCVPGGTGWIMELDALEGKRIQGVLPAFDINNDGKLDTKDFVGEKSAGGSPSGMAVDGVPSATRIMRDSNYVYRINSLSSGTISVNKGNLDPHRNSRVSWRQVR